MTLDINSMFARHQMNADELETSQRVREVIRGLAFNIQAHIPAGPNQTLAIRHLEDALMRCNKAICEDGPLPSQEVSKPTSVPTNAVKVDRKIHITSGPSPSDPIWMCDAEDDQGHRFTLGLQTFITDTIQRMFPHETVEVRIAKDSGSCFFVRP